MTCYFEYRLKEIEETLTALRCKPEQFKDIIQEYEEERNQILSQLNKEVDL